MSLEMLLEVHSESQSPSQRPALYPRANMAPLGKNKGNESIKDTPDRCVPQACGLHHAQSTQNKAVEKK